MIKDLYELNRPIISFEVFPPNKNYNVESIYKTIDQLSELKPDYISVTYGALGTNSNNTQEIASYIQNEKNILALAHLTCLGQSKKELTEILENFKKKNIKNILALRGDKAKSKNKDFLYASDLIERLDKKDFCVAGAFYPEGHIETNDLLDLFNLKKKVDAGAEFLISQIFFDNKLFYDFQIKAKKLNIEIPLIPGIIPVTNAKQIKKITELCGCSIPSKFKKILDLYQDKPEALKEAGIAYAVEQIIDLLSSGVSGVHIYTMNKFDVTKEIMKRIKNIRTSLE